MPGLPEYRLHFPPKYKNLLRFLDQPVTRTVRIKASETNGESVIINVFPSTADGTQQSNTACAIYLGNNVALSNPFKGVISKSGYYLANVVIPSKGTSRVVFKVQLK